MIKPSTGTLFTHLKMKLFSYTGGGFQKVWPAVCPPQRSDSTGPSVRHSLLSGFLMQTVEVSDMLDHAPQRAWRQTPPQASTSSVVLFRVVSVKNIILAASLFSTLTFVQSCFRDATADCVSYLFFSAWRHLLGQTEVPCGNVKLLLAYSSRVWPLDCCCFVFGFGYFQ